MAVSALPVSLFTDPHPLTSVILLVALAVIPFILLAVSSFIKISVVFNILRSAIGAQQVPSGVVISLLSLVLSIHVMAPVISQVAAFFSDTPKVRGQSEGIAQYFAVAQRAAVPVETFLRKHSHARERVYFAGVGDREQPTAPAVVAAAQPLNCDESQITSFGGCPVPGEGLLSLIPAFVLSELSEAFAIGFRVFMPFLIVDLLIAHLLLALGMSMLNPVTVSLPFKLLLLVMSDGWFLLCQGLVEGYR